MNSALGSDVRSHDGIPTEAQFASKGGTPLVIDITGSRAYFLNAANVVTQLGVGSLTSVNMTAPSQFSVSGVPITSSGTIALAWQNQTANRLLSGPATGVAAAPTFRALVAADLPATAVVGPGSSTDRAIPTWNGTGGATLRDNATSTIDASGNLTSPSLLATGGSVPSATVTKMASWVSGSVAIHTFVDGSRTANNRIFDTEWSAGVLSMAFVNDAYSAGTPVLTFTGGHGAGASAIAFPSAATVTHTGAVITNGSLTANGAFTANGNNTLGNAAGDTLTIASNAVTWSNAPTHSNSHVFSGSTSTRGGVAPSASTAQAYHWISGTSPVVSLADSSRTANNRVADTTFTGGVLYRRFINDAYSADNQFEQITGGQGAGVSLIAWPTATSQVFGHTASVTVGNAGKVQVSGITAAAAQAQVSGFAADATTAGTIALSKSRHATNGSNTIVQSGDVLGRIVGYGANGSTYTNAAQISIESDGTPGAADMPGRVVISTTPDGSTTLTEAVRVDNAQKAIFQVDRALRFNNQASAAAANVGTLGNAPAAGDPGYWLKINIGGTNYALPAWAG